MAFSHIQNTTLNTTASFVVITPTSPLSAGNLVVIGIKANTGSVISVTDNASVPNTYVVSEAKGVPLGGSVYLIYGVQITGGATTVTITMSDNVSVRLSLGEYSGGKTTNEAIFDKLSATALGSGSAHSVPSFTPASDGELIVAVDANDSGSGSYTAGTGYTLGGANSVNGQEYKLSSSGAETAPFNYSVSSGYAEIAAAFIPLGSSSGRFVVSSRSASTSRVASGSRTLAGARSAA